MENEQELKTPSHTKYDGKTADEKRQSKIGNILRRVLNEFSPIFAGFGITVQIVSFVGLGAIAKWLLEYWIPFTRYCWTKLAEIIPIPDLTDPEKDSLTSFLFFVPMTISAIWDYAYRRKHRIDHKGGDKYKTIRDKIYASCLGVIFVWVIGKPVVNDGFRIISRTLEEYESPPHEELQKVYFVFLFAVFLVSLPFILLGILKLIPPRHLQCIMSFMKTLHEYTNRIALSFRLQHWASVLDKILTVLFLLTTTFIILLMILVHNLPDFGLIRIVCPILVIIMLALCVIFGPHRLLKISGVVIALVLFSFVWNAIMWAKAFIESVPQ